MVHADRQRCAMLGRTRHFFGELEAQEMHRGGFLRVLALQVFIGDGIDLGTTLDLHPDFVLDADQAGELLLAVLRIRIFQQHGGLEVAAIGDKRVVGIELVMDTGFFEDALDPQHLLHLVAHGEFIFKTQRQMRTECNLAMLFMRHHLGAKGIAFLGIGFQRHQAGTIDLGHG